MERDAETHTQTLDGAGGVLQKLGESLRGLKRTGTPQEEQQSQLTWTLGGSQRLNHQPKSIQEWTALQPDTYVADVQLGLHLSPKLEQGLSQKLLPVCGICSSSWAALSGLSGRESA